MPSMPSLGTVNDNFAIINTIPTEMPLKLQDFYITQSTGILSAGKFPLTFATKMLHGSYLCSAFIQYYRT